MDRREFLKKTLGIGTAAVTAFVTGDKNLLFGEDKKAARAYDLVAVKNAEPEVMFDKAIAEMGGMGAFVKKGQSVVIKPNIGWDVAPELAANTNPKLVKRIVEHCYNAGAKRVYVFDHACDYGPASYKNSGIEQAVKEAGGMMVPAHSEDKYQTVSVPNAKNIKTAKVHELIISSDVFINVPILKHHSSANLTMAMKNLMGIVWDRWFWHTNNLHQCIGEFPAYRLPDLNILDAYAVMKQNGPRGVSVKDLVYPKSLLLSKDIVAIDAAGSLLWGRKPEAVGYLKIADSLKLGKMDLGQLNIQRITL